MLARKEAERLLFQVYQGIDPVEAQREEKRKRESLNVRAYCEKFTELYLKQNWRGTWKAADCTLRNVVIPRWGTRPIHEITRADIVKVMDDYSDRPARRKEIHSVLRKLFNWATDRQDIEVSPLNGMKAPKAVPARRRVLNDEELVALSRARITAAIRTNNGSFATPRNRRAVRRMRLQTAPDGHPNGPGLQTPSAQRIEQVARRVAQNLQKTGRCSGGIWGRLRTVWN